MPHKKTKAAGGKLDEFHWFAAMDRASIAAEFFAEYVAKQPAIEESRLLTDAAVRVSLQHRVRLARRRSGGRQR